MPDLPSRLCAVLRERRETTAPRPRRSWSIASCAASRLAPTHRHLLEMATRRIVCSCDPCALRFENVVEGKFKLIPRDARPLPDFQMTRYGMGRAFAPDQPGVLFLRYA